MAHEVAVIGGVTLRTEGNEIIVEVDLGEDQIEVIREYADIRETAISHHVSGREVQRRIDAVHPLPASLADTEAAVDRILGPEILSPWNRPFDPAEFGFVEIAHVEGLIRSWRKGYHVLHEDAKGGMTMDYYDEHKDRHQIYDGLKPTSAAAARVILQHLGVEGV